MSRLAFVGLAILFYSATAAGFFLLIRGAISNPMAVVKGFFGFLGILAFLGIVIMVATTLTSRNLGERDE